MLPCPAHSLLNIFKQSACFLTSDCVSASLGESVTRYTDEDGQSSGLPPGFYGLSIDMNTDSVGFNRMPQRFEILNCALSHNVLLINNGSIGYIAPGMKCGK